MKQCFDALYIIGEQCVFSSRFIQDIVSSSQSAPTILGYQVDLIFFRVWNLKKRSENMECKKQTAWPLLFLNNNDPAFCTSYFGPNFFSGSQNDTSFQNKNSGCRLTGCLSHTSFLYLAQNF